LAVLIVQLFLKLRLAREAGAIAAKRAMGIPFKSIIKQEVYPIMLSGGAGAMLGIFLAGLFGDDVISLIIAIMGIGLKRIEFTELSVLCQLGIPAILLVVICIVSRLACSQIRKINIAEN
ncbi:MAG: hypothetical protein ACI4EF_03050, partial [Coprococcus sp.]